jgi:putative transposase
VAFIDQHKHRTDGGLRWGVEPICTVLTQHEVPIAPSTYYDARKRRPSARLLSDERWKPIVLATWTRQRRVLGARKLWLRLRREGHDIARCTVERLMRELGIAGVRRGKRSNPVDGDVRETRPADLVDRHFARFRTDQLWVADFTYVWTWSGWVYVAFVFDAHSRRILGWRAAARMTTPLVLDCLEMAFWTRRREGVATFDGLTHHTDAGSVYTSIAFTDRLIDEGIDPSVGSVGDAYDNSMAESQIGLYKTELIHHEGPWRNVDQVEAATAEWVHWFNTERIHSSIDDLTPIELEQLDYALTEPLERAG